VVETRLANAWERFFSACDPLIRGYACRGHQQAADRRDQSQEIWRTVITHLEQYDPARAPFQSWLKTIIVHVAADQAHSLFRHRHVGLGEEGDIVSSVASPAGIPDAGEEPDRLGVAMTKLRARLADTSYQIFHDHWFEGRSYSEIAAGLGIDVKQVRDRNRRAIAMLRELMLRMGRAGAPAGCCACRPGPMRRPVDRRPPGR